ncbi:MAG: saccharopine dehydrogenase [Candidatus Magasanikbacteria bacterium RIFOXYD2_FULL_36_9]|uniref:Saccharopine dehydrogenase n=1 Tax=Candidatus Magasanikbacteria bacterium RIFOXYD2_FULL_36_9 TaxID=1798707 RepID=A0A1F6P2G1_9BACT|nr:MAG: saccharopine dehydrogenase [Candidatus Magasanikbacteria bacterium RIFOXYD2_FULL_36_9]
MNKVLILGAGGVAKVTALKCAQQPEVFNEIILASRTLAKCDAIAEAAKRLTGTTIKTEAVSVTMTDNTDLVALLEKHRPNILINLVDPYFDLIVMEACLKAKVNYVDTANFEPVEEARMRYDEQWAMSDKFKEAGLLAVLGCGFDPGVSQAMTAYAAKNYFNEMHELHIMDCNAGDHGHVFATNFSPEINIREVGSPARFWKDGQWVNVAPIISPLESRPDYHFAFNYPEIGPKETYLIYHEELQSLVKNFPTLKVATFGMTFGPQYLTHLRVLQNVGMTRIDAVDYNGTKVVPVKFLEKLLPDPASLAKNYTGKTNIGCVIKGLDKNNESKSYYIYNICDHAQCYKETESQGISYTAGVPPMTGAKMILQGEWQGTGVFNVEQLNPDPFMKALMTDGLPWVEVFDKDVPEINWEQK